MLLMTRAIFRLLLPAALPEVAGFWPAVLLRAPLCERFEGCIAARAELGPAQTTRPRHTPHLVHVCII